MLSGTLSIMISSSDTIIGGGGAGAGIASIAAVVVPVIAAIPVAIPVPYAPPPFRWNEADIDTEPEY